MLKTKYTLTKITMKTTQYKTYICCDAVGRDNRIGLCLICLMSWGYYRLQPMSERHLNQGKRAINKYGRQDSDLISNTISGCYTVKVLSLNHST